MTVAGYRLQHATAMHSWELEDAAYDIVFPFEIALGQVNTEQSARLRTLLLCLPENRTVAGRLTARWLHSQSCSAARRIVGSERAQIFGELAASGYASHAWIDTSRTVRNRNQMGHLGTHCKEFSLCNQRSALRRIVVEGQLRG
jgi:hypothetical protein